MPRARALDTVAAPVMSVAVAGDRRLLTGCWPTSARSRLVLPTPLRPSTQVTLPGSASSEIAAQRLRRAVVQIDGVDLEHGHRPR